MAKELTEEGTSRTVQTADWKLHYNEAGEGHPIVLLHGSGAGATGWSNFRPNIGYLSQRYRVLAVDMPGWGKSDAALAEDYDHAEATLQLLDTLGIEKAALVGNSMGGMTSLTFATRYPDRISHLITMGPGSGKSPTLFGAGDGPTEGLKVLWQAYRDPSPESMKKVVEIMTFDSSTFGTDELAQQRSDNARSRPDHLKNFLASMPGGGPVRKMFRQEQLGEIQTPTLLIHGRDDRVVHFEHSLRLVASIPNSRLVLFNRCGHWAQLEHADEFNRLVDQFVTTA